MQFITVNNNNNDDSVIEICQKNEIREYYQFFSGLIYMYKIYIKEDRLRKFSYLLVTQPIFLKGFTELTHLFMKV